MSITKDGETWKHADGTIVRRRTKRLGLVIQRQRYTYKGEVRYANGFHLEVMIDGKTAYFPLGTDAGDAAKRADEIGAFLALPENTLEMARREYDPRGVARSSKFATLGEVFTKHEEGFRTIGISESTAKGYRLALLRVIRYADAWQRNKRAPELQRGCRLDMSPWLKLPTSILTAKQMLDFKAAMIPRPAKIDGVLVEPDEEEILTAQISCDSAMLNARALFSEGARRYYRLLKLPLPDLTEWFEVPIFGAKKYFELPPMEAVETIFADVAALKKADLNAWRAFMLCVHLGLRKGEAGAARWDWIEAPQSGPIMKVREAGEFKPKHGTGRKLVFESWVHEELKAARGEASPTIVEGATETERTVDVFARLNTWLQQRGITATKPTHELRKLWFSYTVKAKGLLTASQQGGHRDTKVTSDHYADNMMPEELLRFWRAA